ncbi:Fic family protein [Fodinicola acaciae]|uniref:Fic family protein n=1 Tax=Fodinicola acaciae TaxID=2681555 RepID=UPI0013D3137C|nr:Fic family protein [Fodinicola acaciae]
MNVPISPREQAILRLLAAGVSLSRADIATSIGESRVTTIRALNDLLAKGLIHSRGEARATKYRLTGPAGAVVLWDANAYLAQDPDARGARYRHLEPDLFQLFDGSIGQLPALIETAARARRRVGDSLTARRDLERFVIELSWKSSKIEGNTYSLLDTERLLRDAQEASGHDHAEAVMILNHKRAFDYVWQHQVDFRQLSRQQVLQVHELLVAGLDVPLGLRTRPVGITGTVYTPPGSKTEIAAELDQVIAVINELQQPVEKALACLVLLAYLQPFADGNKRTSRLVANAVLLAYGYPPLSYRGVDEQEYKGALILFYEQGTLANFRELYLKQLQESAENYYFPIGSVDVA